MERPRLAPGHTSTYGQACMQCYKAKCRCVPSARRGDACERCRRLRKQCQPSDSLRRRNAQKAEESDIRIARLEGRIETLLSAMQSMASSNGPSPEIQRLLDGESIALSTSSSKPTPANSTALNPSISGGPSPAALAYTNPFPPSHCSPLPYGISQSQAETSLLFFRSHMLPCFPFINLAPGLTAWQLHQDRPFLFQAILTVTSFSTQVRLARAEELKHVLYTSAFVNTQSNTDLLLGLLTYLAWSTDAFLGRADLVSRLMMLAISLVYDLRLFKPSQTEIKIIVAITQGQNYDNGENASEETVEDLVEKQRAVLACFVLSSNISFHLGRLDALRWTPQMDEALRVIGTNKLCLTDKLFASQVRLQLLKQRAAYIREEYERDRARTSTAFMATSTPGLLYLKTLRGQLHELLAYAISWESPLFNMSGPRSDSGILPGYERLEYLWQSVENIKSWLDNFYNIPPSELAGFPFHFWSQMIRCITFLKYLSVLEDPSWDRQAVRKTVDLISTMECMTGKLDSSGEGPGLDGEDNVFKLLSKLLNRCRVWADTRWNNTPPETGSQQSAYSDAHSQDSYIPDLDQMAWIQSMNLESDQWFEDVLGWPTASI
ncbi:hypothetical protein UA08_09293 [Talaromyces atroroseus]|uniref:Zn(2)-C6 fungal-type domain-containing protein n=1 Tax=Talaromyces atroroseus TaxID=1441469 RepID=A0A1Q5Q6M9_TALAT|nr:hypothetical protein UA08_09293 [Talaromyces atroroseus]OKL55400.1 hypothetical protein UA08_09293 [Talaromyces atroroseus]